MVDTYTQHAEICARFYEWTSDAESISKFLIQVVQPNAGDSALFVGGMFHVAATLAKSGVNITCIDYTDQMVRFGKQALPSCKIIKADLRELVFDQEFDIIFVIGRVFTHMITPQDLTNALQSCRRSLRPGGKLFADNYEKCRIQQTSYFNGTVEGVSPEGRITRKSCTERLNDSPFVVQWIAEYSGTINGKAFQFEDSMPHRAFSRHEFRSLLEAAQFEVLSQGENFDETSFFTLARK